MEREKKDRRKDAADEQHEITSAALGKRLDDIEEQQRLQIKEYSEKVEMLKSKHESDMRLYNSTLASYAEQIAKTCIYNHSQYVYPSFRTISRSRSCSVAGDGNYGPWPRLSKSTPLRD